MIRTPAPVTAIMCGKLRYAHADELQLVLPAAKRRRARAEAVRHIHGSSYCR